MKRVIRRALKRRRSSGPPSASALENKVRELMERMERNVLDPTEEQRVNYKEPLHTEGVLTIPLRMVFSRSIMRQNIDLDRWAPLLGIMKVGPYINRFTTDQDLRTLMNLIIPEYSIFQDDEIIIANRDHGAQFGIRACEFEKLPEAGLAYAIIKQVLEDKIFQDHTEMAYEWAMENYLEDQHEVDTGSVDPDAMDRYSGELWLTDAYWQKRRLIYEANTIAHALEDHPGIPKELKDGIMQLQTMLAEHRIRTSRTCYQHVPLQDQNNNKSVIHPVLWGDGDDVLSELIDSMIDGYVNEGEYVSYTEIMNMFNGKLNIISDRDIYEIREDIRNQTVKCLTLIEQLHCSDKPTKGSWSGSEDPSPFQPQPLY